MDIVYHLFNQLQAITFKSIILTSLILILITLLFLIIKKLGLFYYPKIHQQIFNKFTILYLNVEGNDQVFYDTFKNIDHDIKQHFKISNKFGYYFQNPVQARKMQKCRATLGILINQGQKHKIQNFLTVYPHYHKGLLPTAKCLAISYPYLNNISYTLIADKLYPKLLDHVKKYELQNQLCYLEVYNFLSELSKSVKIMIPIEKQQQFNKWQ